MRMRTLAQAIAVSAISLVLVACSLNASPKTKKFVVVDKGSGYTISTYAYAEGSKRPSEIHAYGPDRKLKDSHYLQYDAQGRLTSDSLVRNSVTGAPSTSLLTYSYQDTVGDGGQLVKSVQTASTGEAVETYYGYDETGTARGVVQKTGDALMMKDYPQ